MNKYGVVRLDKIISSKVGHIHSVVNEDEILENGMVGIAGDFLEGERELKKFDKPTGTDQKVVLIAAPEINYSEYRRADAALGNFFIEKGKPARAYDLNAGDIISVSKDMVTALADDVVAGNFVTTQAGEYVMAEVASDTDEAFLGKIVGVEQIGTVQPVGQAGTKFGRVTELVVIEIVRNKA